MKKGAFSHHNVSFFVSTMLVLVMGSVLDQLEERRMMKMSVGVQTGEQLCGGSR